MEIKQLEYFRAIVDGKCQCCRQSSAHDTTTIKLPDENAGRKLQVQLFIRGTKKLL